MKITTRRFSNNNLTSFDKGLIPSFNFQLKMLFGVFNRLAIWIRNRPLSLWQWLVGFTFIVFIRNLLEGLVNGYILPPGAFFFQYSILYFVGGLISIIILSVATRQKPSQVLFPSLLLLSGIILVPIIDSIFTGGSSLSYLEGDIKTLAQKFLTGILFWRSKDLSLGQRVEVFYFILVASLYLFASTKNLLRTLFAFFALYLSGFIFIGSLPALLSQIYGLTSSEFLALTTTLIPKWDLALRLFEIYVFSGFFLAILIFLLQDRFIFKEILLRLNLSHTLFYILSFLLGIWLGIGHRWYFLETFSFFDGLVIANSILALLLLRTSVVFVNDLSDLKVDKAGHSLRPLASGKLSFKQGETIALLSAFASIYIAAGLDYFFLVVILICHLISLLYSLPPLRLRRFLILPNLFIASATLLLFLSGYLLGGGSLLELPKKIMIAIFLLVTFSSFLKDFKEIEADKINKIITLPVLFGKETAQIIVGLILALTTFGLLFLFGKTEFFLFGLFLAITIFLFIQGKQPDERVLFLIGLYFLFLLFSSKTISLPVSTAIQPSLSQLSQPPSSAEIRATYERILSRIASQKGFVKTLKGSPSQPNQWQEIESPYFPSLILDILSRADPERRTTQLRQEIREWLNKEKEPPGLWQFFGKKEKRSFPLDADDSALALVALLRSGNEVSPESFLIFEKFRDKDGRFFTWFDEKMVAEGKNEVDLLVNINTLYLFCLTGREAPELVRYIKSEVKNRNWLEGSVYSVVAPYDISYLLSRAIAYGQGQCQELASLKDFILQEILSRQRLDGGWGETLPTLLATATLLNLDGPPKSIEKAIANVIELERSGRLSLAQPFFREPQGDVVYASSLFQEALALESLWRYQELSQKEL